MKNKCISSNPLNLAVAQRSLVVHSLRCFIGLITLLVININPVKAGEPVHLIDYNPEHSKYMLQVAANDGVEVVHHSSGLLSGMNEAWLDKAQIVVIPTLFGPCEAWWQPTIINALKKLSETSKVYIPARNCPTLSNWTTFVAAVNEAGNRPVILGPVDNAELYVYGCSLKFCSDSEAVVRAGWMDNE